MICCILSLTGRFYLTLITRYMATILNGSKNPHHAMVMSDIINAILKRHANEGEQGAKYWDQGE